MAAPEETQKTCERMATEEEKQTIRRRMVTEEAQESVKVRLSTAAGKRKTRQRKAKVEALCHWREAKALRVSATKSAARAHTEKAYANKQP